MLTLMLSALALPASSGTGEAQQTGKVARVGFLYAGAPQSGLGAERYAAFLDGMRDLGYVVGRNLVVEARFAESDAERLPTLVDELLRARVDVIVATGSQAYRVLRQRPSTLPVVVTVTADPILARLADTLARPGGRFTGLSDTAADLGPKQLELLKAVVPKLSRIGILLNPSSATHPAQVTRLMLAAQKVGIQVVLAEAGTVEQIEPGFAVLGRARADAIVLLGDTLFSQQLRPIALTALKHRLPSV